MVQSCKLIQIIIICLVLFPIVSAAETTHVFRQNDNVTLAFTCFDPIAGQLCDAAFVCTLSVQYPNGTLLLNNQSTIVNGIYYEANIPDTSVLNNHQYTPFCTNQTNGGVPPEQLQYKITPTGTELTTGQGIIYFLVLVLSITLFIMMLFGAIRIPWKHKTDDDGRVFGMNNLRYAKLALWFMSYVFIIVIFFLMWNISFAFLSFDALSNFFGFFFKALAGMVPLVFISFIIFGIMDFLLSKKLQKRIRRGLNFRYDR